MATKVFYFNGVSDYNTNPQKPDNYDNYSITISLDDDSLEKYLNSGIQGKLKGDTGRVATFRRPHRKIIKNELKEFEAPSLVDDANKPMVCSVIGKGSDVTVKVTVYDTIKGPGSSLESIRINNLQSNYEVDSSEKAPW